MLRQKLIPPFLVAYALTLVSCGSFSSAIEAGPGSRSVKKVPFESWWSQSLHSVKQTATLPDNGIAALRRVEKHRYALESYDHELTLRWSQPITLEEGEEEPQLLRIDPGLLVLFRRELADDRWQLVARRFDPATGRLSDARPMLQTEIDPEEDFHYFLSPDSSYLLMSARARTTLERDSNGDKHSHTPFTLAVFDRQLRPVQERHIDLTDALFGERLVFADMTVSNSGNIDIGYAHYANSKYLTALRHFPATGGDGMIFDDTLAAPSVDPEDASPAQLKLLQLPDNWITGILRLNDGRKLRGLVAARWNTVTGTHEFHEILPITDSVAEHLTGEDQLDRYQVSDLFDTDRGMLLLLETSSGSSFSLMTTGLSGNLAWYGPILLLRFDRNFALMQSAKTDRDEDWSSGWPAGETSGFEGGHAAIIAGDSLTLLTREREYDGIVMRRISLDGLHASAPRTLVRLGNMSYFAREYTNWLPDGEIVIWGKEGLFGNDWEILRVTL
jgi:hypothetical protein